MVRKLHSSDFRARRLILEPEDFALTDGKPDPRPTDLISEEVWNALTTLPGDVAIRTTSHQGTRIAILYELWSGWVHAIPRDGIVAEAMLDSADDFAISLFNLLHGFYKPSISALRNALEAMTLACACVVSGDSAKWNSWQRGEQVRFKLECDTLQSLPQLRIREQKAQEVAGVGIFMRNEEDGRNAWARDLYQRLSRFTHARGDSTNSALWNSNGPIYSADGMKISYHAYLETYSLLLLIAKASLPDLKMPAEAYVIYKRNSYKQYLSPPFWAVCAFYNSELFPQRSRSKTTRTRKVLRPRPDA
jgi:hypothetical protein